jgi:ABC-type branched-subunit amino acid transport system ATPase component
MTAAAGRALSLRGVSKRFGGIAALTALALDVPLGEIHGLIGPNGAGKTTAINIATGFYAPDEGSVWMFDREVTRLAPDERAGLGFARTFQSSRVFGNLDVRTNLAIAVEQRRRCEGAGRAAREVHAEVDALLDAGGLRDYAGEPGRLLPYGRQKQLEIVRATAFARSVLLLDEPAAGLSDTEIDDVLAHVLAHRGRLAILIVEHNMDVVMSTCDRVTVIDAGRWIATGTPDEVQRDPGVVAAYLGA